MRLIEGMKSVGKTTNYDSIDINKAELLKRRNENLTIDRMFIKEYVYATRGLSDTVLTTLSIFDEITIILPTSLKEYNKMFSDRIMNDKDFHDKMLKTLNIYNKEHKGKDICFAELNRITLERYLKISKVLREHCFVEIKIKNYNIEVYEISFFQEKVRLPK